MRPSTHHYVYIPTMWHKSTWSRRLISTYIYQQCDTNLHGPSTHQYVYTNNVTQICMRPSTHQYVYIHLHGAVDSWVRIYTNNVWDALFYHISTCQNWDEISVFKVYKNDKKISIYTSDVFHSILYNYIK